MRKPEGLIRIIVVEYFHAVRHVGALTAALLANNPYEALAHCKDARSDLYYTGKWLAKECERRLEQPSLASAAERYARKVGLIAAVHQGSITTREQVDEALRS